MLQLFSLSDIQLFTKAGNDIFVTESADIDCFFITEAARLIFSERKVADVAAIAFCTLQKVSFRIDKSEFFKLSIVFFFCLSTGNTFQCFAEMTLLFSLVV